MAKRKRPILTRAWELITFPMGKVRRLTIISRSSSNKLLLFHKSSKRFRLLKHYNCAFLRDYEYSPSSTPLFGRSRRSPLKKRSWFLCLLCSGGRDSVSNDDIVDNSEFWLENSDGGSSVIVSVVDEAATEALETEEWSEEEESVDRRAEEFIERFYEGIRLQRQESVMQYREMMDRSC